MIQPNYLPWRGYFDFIDDVDIFIFYDDVQYTHRDWRNRNKIKTNQGLRWLSVPVRHDSSSLICEARISHETGWARKHLRSLEIAYSKAPYFAGFYSELADLIIAPHETIADLDIALIHWVMRRLAIKTRTLRSSEIGIAGDKWQKPLRILRELGATSYLSGPAAKPYIDPAAYRNSGISLEFKAYVYPEYPQLHGPFAGNVSVLDLLFNCGPDARRYMKSFEPNERYVDSA